MSIALNNRSLHANELRQDIDLVRALVDSQFPSWSYLALVELEAVGTDNRLYRLGSDLAVRMPRTRAAALQIDKERSWLPLLAPHLPLETPEPVALGAATPTYPAAWSVVRWIEGSSPTVLGTQELAASLAAFIVALRMQPAVGGPTPGAHNSFRGEPLALRDRATRAALRGLNGSFNKDALLSAWDTALRAEPWRGAPHWIHGDLLPSNILVRQNKIVAVLDFGLLGTGDPATDLMAAWTSMTGSVRQTFLSVASPGESAATRGRGWALTFAAAALPYYEPLGHPLAIVAERTLNAISSEVLSAA